MEEFNNTKYTIVTEDKQEAITMLKANQLAGALIEIKDDLRRILKYEDNSEDVCAIVERIRDRVFELCEGLEDVLGEV